MKILVVEDDERISSFIRRGLREEGFSVEVAPNAAQGLDLAVAESYSLIILDWMLPDSSGIDLLKELRRSGSSVPVLLLTAKGDMADKVEGLSAGADDYLTKPFGFEELLARVRALSRRRGELLPDVHQVGPLSLDTLQQRVSLAGRPIHLTAREFALLELFMNRKGEVVTRTMMAEKVWEHDFDPFSNVIDVTIARLRKKIAFSPEAPVIETVRGRGYRLSQPVEA